MAITQVDLPGVYGAVQREKTGRLQNQLQELQLQQGQQEVATRNQLKPLLAPAAQGDQEAIQGVMGTDPELGMRFQEHAMKMADETREQMQYEAPLVARVMSNVQDQDAYAMGLNALGNAGVDISDFPEEYDPQTVSLMVAMGQEADKLKPTSAMQEYQQAVNQGFKGTFLDYKRELAEANRAQTTITNNMGPQGIDYGKPEPGLTWLRNPDGTIQLDERGAPIAVPYQGGSVFREQQESERERTAAAEAEQERADVQMQTEAGKAETMLDATGSIKEIMKDASTPVTGTTSRPFALHSGTAAGQVRSYVGTLKSGVALGAIQRLKEASATGATGFGAMNEAELQLLIDDIGALDPDTTEPEIFMKTVDRIERRYRRVVEDIRKNVSPDRIKELGLEPLLSSVEGGGEGEAMDFTTMEPQELLSVDVDSLNAEQLKQLEAAMDAAGL